MKRDKNIITGRKGAAWMAWYEIFIVSVGLSLDVFTYALSPGAIAFQTGQKADPENESCCSQDGRAVQCYLSEA